MIRVRPAALDPATLVPALSVLTGAAVVIALGSLVTTGPERVMPDEHGILPCPASARQDLLSADALQCWFEARNGRWRTLNRVSAHGALVVEVEATAMADAENIAQQFVTDRGGGRFSEVLVYVEGPSAPPRSIRRIRWTGSTGFETMDFVDR
jgi:hypothetical protein